MYKPKIRIKPSLVYDETLKIIKDHKLHTVCEEAACPNIHQCWSSKHATMMILGSVCTRSCRFCNVKTGKPNELDEYEPARVALAVQKLGLNHVVITSVDRDDLPDGGATHFLNTIRCIRQLSPDTTVEILTPDFLRKNGAKEIIAQSKPDVFNHNLETVPRLYRSIRPGASYFHSLQLLQQIKTLCPEAFTKSGIMVGFGESQDEIIQVMDDLRAAEVDFITIGQYLQPTPKHYPIQRYLSDQEFRDLESFAWSRGFLMVSCSPLTRSSFHADEHFSILKQNRLSNNVQHTSNSNEKINLKKTLSNQSK